MSSSAAEAEEITSSSSAEEGALMKKVEGKDLTRRYQAGPERRCQSDNNNLVGSDPGSDHGDQDQIIATSRASDKPLLNKDFPDTGSDRCDGCDDLHPHSSDDETEAWEADL